MSDESNGNGNGRVNPLDRLFKKESIRVVLLDAHEEPVGVVGVFKPVEPRHKAQYDRIIQKGFGGRKPKFDDGEAYIFPLIVEEIEGLTADDCGGVEPIKYCQTHPQGKRLRGLLVDAYWRMTLPTADEDEAKK